MSMILDVTTGHWSHPIQMNSVFLLTTMILTTKVSSTHRKCSFIDYRGMNHTDEFHKRECSSHEVCQRPLNISYIDVPPYSSGYLFESIVEICCGKSCTNFSTANYYYNISEVKLSHSHSDFILSFLGELRSSDFLFWS